MGSFRSDLHDAGSHLYVTRARPDRHPVTAEIQQAILADHPCTACSSPDRACIALNHARGASAHGCTTGKHALACLVPTCGPHAQR